MKHGKPAVSEHKKAMIEKVLHEVLMAVRPTPNEIRVLTARSNEIMGRLKAAAPKNVEIILAGSVARGTQVRGSSDIDIFLLFPKTMKEERMEAEGLKIAKSIVKRKMKESYEIKYAEHPYTRLFLHDVNVTADIVPAFKISSAEEMGSAVDRTQLHNEFVNTKLTEKQRNDVRILKTFLNARSVYGAEAAVEGFSGYLCELLVYYYGSFIKVLESFAEIRLPAVLDILNKGQEVKNAKEVSKRFNSEFVVIDPTDRNRNVAANVSKESIGKTVLGARAFLRNPSVHTFYVKGHSHEKIMKALKELEEFLNIDIYLMAFRLPDITEDILWQQLKRLRQQIVQHMEHAEFKPILSFQSISGREAIMALFIGNAENRVSEIRGPSALIGKAAEGFIESHKKTYVFFDGDRLVSIEKPKFKSSKEAARAVISKNNIKFPSYISKKGARLYINSFPERYAIMLHDALHEKIAHE
ncbi:MAG TPA: CCA tRNA nucleotidyltransferase [Candidatus Acidoferrum sp.]|nr:CCA tRNA nucleotidyltransferase [Candidatus Acidoferrum sp.]